MGLGWLVAGRFAQGLGGGGLVPLSLALAADLYPGPGRPVALGAVAALQEAGSVFGPLYGATVAAAASSAGGWRFVFWLNVPLAAACAAGLVLAWPRARDAARVETSSIDWPGAVLLGAGLGLAVFALYPDDPERRAVNGLFIPAMAAAAVLVAAYAWRQGRRLDPLIPRELLRTSVFAAAMLANLLVGAALMVALVDVPLLGRAVFNLDALGSGLLLTQFLVGVPVGAAVGGLATAKLGPRVVAAAGMALSALAFLQMATWQAGELGLRLGPLRQADLALGACGLGFGLVIAPVTAAVLGLTRGGAHGLATSLVVLARTVGMLLGLSSLTAFGLYRFRQILGTPVLHGADLRARLKELEDLVAAAYLKEYREIFTVAAVLCVLAAAISALWLRQASRSGDT